MEFLLTSSFWSDTLWGLFRLLRQMFLVLVPIVIVLEFLRATRLFPWLIDRLARPLSIFGFEKESVFALLAGTIFGITLGAGVLIAETKARGLPRRQVFLISVFLAICHAVFEDTLIFMAVGASGLVMLGTRFPAAIIAVLIVTVLLRSPWYAKARKAFPSTK